MYSYTTNSVDFWVSFSQTLPEPVFIINNEGDFIYKNDVFNQAIPLSTHNFFTALSKSCLEQLKKCFQECCKEEKIVKSTLMILIKKKETLHFSYYLKTLEKNHFLLMLHENTAFINENLMLHNIINTAPDPIFVKDQKHKYLCINEAFSELVGHPAKDLLGKSDRDFFPKKECDLYYRLDRKTFRSGETTVNEDVFLNLSGKSYTISTKKSVFETLGGTKILVGVIRDMTEVTQEKKSLTKQAKELKRQVDVRTKQLMLRKNDLEQAVETLKHLNSDLDCFAHICCHELREPLRTISSFSQLLLTEYEAGKVDNIGAFLKIIREGTIRMNELIHSILEYSTNGLRGNTFSVFSSKEMVEEVLIMIATPIQEKNASITMGPLPEIYADRLQVTQLFQNLISNAIKFSGTTNAPVIHISASQKNEFAEFYIQDKGIGIAKEYIKDLFKPFKKFHSREEGSMYGIGLSLCKKIVENHNGSIKLTSKVGEGTIFKFLLPTPPVELGHSDVETPSDVTVPLTVPGVITLK